MKNYFKLVMLFCLAVSVFSCKEEEEYGSISIEPKINIMGVLDGAGAPQNIADGSIVLTPATETEYAITVKANDWWNATVVCEGDEWASIPTGEGTGGSTLTTMNVTFSENTGFTSRTATLTFQTEPAINGAFAKKTFTLVQTKAGEYVVSNVGAEGLSMTYDSDDETTFLLSTNQSVTTSIVYPEGYSGEEWLSVSPSTLPVGSEQTVTVATTALNGTGADRTAIVRLLTSGATGDKDTCDITVTQAFLAQSIAFYESEQADFSLAGTSEIKDSVLVVSNVPFTAALVDDATDAAPTWLDLASASYEATTAEGVWVKFTTNSYNTTSSDRTATLTLETTGEYGVDGAKVSVTVGIKQVKFVQSLEFVNEPQTDPIVMAAIADVKDSVKVVSNVAFTVVPTDKGAQTTPSWLNLASTSFEASPDGVWVKFNTTSLNGTPGDRTATLTIATTGEYGEGGAKVTITVDVKQIKFVQTLKLAYDTQVDPIVVEGKASIKDSVRVVSNVPFTVAYVDDATTLAPDWLTIPTVSYPASPDSVWVKFNTLTLNGTGADKTATLTFTAEAGWGDPVATFDIGVKQSAFIQELAFVNSPQDSVFLAITSGAKDSVQVTSNVPFTAAFDGDPTWLALTTTAFAASPDGVWVKFNTTSLNETGDDRKAKLVLTGDAGYGDTPPSINVGVKQYGKLISAAYVTPTSNFNSDSLYVAWTGDAAYASYDVIAVKNPSVSAATDTLVKARVNAPTGATASTQLHSVLTGVALLDAYNGLVSVKVVPYLAGGIKWTNGTSTAVDLHTKYADASGDGSAVGSEILIANARHLQNMSLNLAGFYKVTSNFSFASFIDADANYTFTPIGQAVAPFTGDFNGDSKTITGIRLRNNNSGSGSTGLFGQISSTAKVHDVTIANPDLYINSPGGSEAPTYPFDATVAHGVAVGYNNGGTVDGVNVIVGEKDVSFGGASISGGVVGINGKPDKTTVGTVSNCHVSASGTKGIAQGSNGGASKAGSVYLGGVVGVNYGMNYADGYGTYSTSLAQVVADLCVVINCSNSASVRLGAQGSFAGGATGTKGLMVTGGGIVGGNDGLVESCYNTGTIGAASTNVVAGAIVGSTITANNSASDADFSPLISPQAHRSLGCRIIKCFNSGEVATTSTITAGGIAGILGLVGATAKLGNSIIDQCYNSGAVTSTGAGGTVTLGGLVGQGPRAYISNSYNEAEVTISSAVVGAAYKAGGLVGDVVSTLTMEYCYNNSSVSAFTDATSTAQKSAGTIFGSFPPTSGNSNNTKLNYCYANATALDGPGYQDVTTARCIMKNYLWGFPSKANKDSFEGGSYLFLQLDGVAMATGNTVTLTNLYHKTADEMKGTGWSWPAGYDSGIWTILPNDFPRLINVVTAQ